MFFYYPEEKHTMTCDYANVFKYIFAFILIVIIPNCAEDDKGLLLTYAVKYTTPNYSGLNVVSSNDTMHFSLGDNTFNKVASSTYFVYNGNEYFSFFDSKSKSINIYDFKKQNLIKRIDVKEWLKEGLVETSVYVLNFDSICVNNQKYVRLFDSSGTKKKELPIQEKPFLAFASFNNSTPPVFTNNTMFTKAEPELSKVSNSDLKKMRVMYRFDLLHDYKSIEYNLPKLYLDSLYSYFFIESAYCYNNKDRFIFSFAADTNIYETDLKNYQTAYNGRSQYQASTISPIQKNEDVSTGEAVMKNFMTRDSYGSIFYDRYRNRYLRIAKFKLTEQEYKSKTSRKRQSLIIFDENLHIIGESKIDKEISLSSLFFTRDGNLYARTNINDEYAIHYIRLYYSNEK